MTLAEIKDHIILINKYCTCSETDIFATNHQSGCGYKRWFDKWEREYLDKRDWGQSQ